MSEQVLAFRFPCGQGGLNRSKNLQLIPETDLVYVEELTVENQCWEKGPGATKYNGLALGAGVLGLHDFRSGTGLTQELVAALDDGRLVTVAGGGGITKTLASGLTTGGFPVFTEGVVSTSTKALFYYDQKNTPHVYTGGASASTINDPNVDWNTFKPSGAFNHSFRTVAYGNLNNPHTLYLSDPDNHGDFSSNAQNTRVMPVYPGEWDYISGGISWRERGYIFKHPQGVYYIDDRDSNLANWEIRKVMDAIGVAGPGCIVGIENDVVLLGSDGYFYKLSDVLTPSGQRSIDPILPIEIGEYVREQINVDQLAMCRSVYYPRKRQLWFAMPGSGDATNTVRLVFDFNIAEKIRLLWSTRDECQGLTIRRNNKTSEPIWGDSGGDIYRGDQAARNKASAAYNSQYETPPKGLVDAGMTYTNLHQIQVVFKPEGDYDLELEVHRDTTLGHLLTFSQQSQGSPSGSFSLDSDVLAGTTIAHDIDRLEGEARYTKLVGRNNVANETFAVVDHIITYTPGRSAMV